MTEDNSNSWLIDSWRGRSPAYKVFWVYAVPINILLFISGVAAGYFASSHPWITSFVFVVGPLYLIFLVWFCVSLWRCAFNVGWSGWGYLSRAWVTFVATGTLLKLFQIVKLIVSS